jgi:hypothetical protein
MKSLKFIVRLALFVLVLFAVAASTHAQQCPGYNPTMEQSPNPGTTSAYNPPTPCAGKSLFSTASFSQTNSTWAAFAACMVIGWAIAASWPGKLSPAFWIVLAVIDLVPAGMLGLFLLILFKLKEVAGQVTAKP